MRDVERGLELRRCDLEVLVAERRLSGCEMFSCGGVILRVGGGGGVGAVVGAAVGGLSPGADWLVSL